jgi:protein-disulfide isomerase
MRAAVALCAIVLTLAGQRVSAARLDVVEGNPASPVKVVIYEDLQCADCARFQAMFEQKILPRYGARVAFVHRDFPLGKHDWARQAAVAARWVWDQDNGYGILIRRELLSEQDHITPAKLNKWLVDFADRKGLDQKGIIDCLNDRRYNALVDQDVQGAVARGLKNTPTVFVGGQAFTETIVYEDLARALDNLLAK